MSSESGIPTFRGSRTSLWRNYRPEDLATPEAFARDPALVWDWYAMRLAILDRAKPNPGHIALTRIAERINSFSVITQNVDGLHELAGSKHVIELHGNIRRAKCTRCAAVVAAPFRSEERRPNGAPLCDCGAPLRPDVVWFGEALPPGTFERATAAAAAADVFIVSGTSAVVYPAAALVGIAKSAGAFLVEVNPERTDASAACDLRVRARSGEFLPLVARQLEARLGN